MCILRPHCDSSLLHELVHLAQDLVPVALRSLMPLGVEYYRIKMLSQCSFVQRLSDMVSALFVPSSLLMRSEELKIPIKSLSNESLPHSFHHHRSSVFLSLTKVAYASPAPHRNRQSPIKQLPKRLIDSPSFAGPHSLSLYPQLLLSFEHFILQLLVLLHHGVSESCFVPSDLNMCILLPVVKVTIHVVVVHVNDSTFYFDVHGLLVGKGVVTPLGEVTVETLAEGIADHVARAGLVLTSALILFVGVEGSGFSDGDVHFVFDCATCQLILRSFSVVSELIEDVM